MTEVIPAAAMAPALEVNERKQLGAFYTPPELVAPLTRWAVRERSDRVIDPSFGGLAFVDRAVAELRRLGARSLGDDQIVGVDIDEDAFRRARRRAGQLSASVRLGDFLSMSPSDLGQFRAGIGNPPYVRFQRLGAQAEALDRLAERTGVKLSRLSSSWAPFVVHLIEFLEPGGRLALVLPAEILHAQYAGKVLEHLDRSFASVSLAAFQERVFPGALEEVVLLFADGRGENGRRGVSLIEFANVEDLDLPALAEESTRPLRSARSGKLLEQLLPDETQGVLDDLAGSNDLVTLGELGSVDIGAVTGGNAFFLVSEQDEDAPPAELLLPAVSKAAHIRGAQLRSADIDEMRSGGAAMDLFVAGGDTDSALISAASGFLERGHRLGLPTRYKCRVRDPWWAIPLPRTSPADLLLIYCSSEFPRLAVNEARALNTNAVHGITLGGSSLSAQDLAGGFLNSLTLLSAELVGRSYGGGVLKLEPTEAERLLIPVLDGMGEHLDDVDRCLRHGELSDVLGIVDPLVLGEGLGLGSSEIRALRAGAEKLRARRRARGRRPR